MIAPYRRAGCRRVSPCSAHAELPGDAPLLSERRSKRSNDRHQPASRDGQETDRRETGDSAPIPDSAGTDRRATIQAAVDCGRVMFGEVLRRRRLRAGLTQEELAHRSGISVRNIRDIERGSVTRPRAGTVTLLVEALGLDVDERRELADLARGDLAPGGKPAQLPAAVTGFAGRTAALHRLDAALVRDAHADPFAIYCLVAGAAALAWLTVG
jgi:transcriptional regulator with XRE-family HTH domain